MPLLCSQQAKTQVAQVKPKVNGNGGQLLTEAQVRTSAKKNKVATYCSSYLQHLSFLKSITSYYLPTLVTSTDTLYVTLGPYLF
jgi:hypothetical protein